VSSLGVKTIRLGTRGSTLALTQSGLVADAIAAPVELVRIKTVGDRSTASIESLGSTGVFVSALRDALLAGEIDLAVHSYKDLPTAPAEGLVIAAVPERADHRDALIARDGLTFGELPAGSTVGTGALRRVAQLRSVRPDLEYVPIRGNVDTRMRKVDDGELDAVVLAAAGISRLGRAAEITELLDPDLVLPAPAQGALAVECRAGELHDLLSRLDHAPSRGAVTAERAMLATLESGCHAPIGAYAEVHDDKLVLRGMAAAPDGSTVVRREATGSITDAERIGIGLAAELLSAGVADLLGSSR
jgi:hydroxymethylbilane synthase